MRYAALVLAVLCLPSLLQTQEKTDEGPTNDKARKTYQQALELAHKHPEGAADAFKKADKEDGGHCRDCQRKMIKYGVEFRDWKTAELGADEALADAKDNNALALGHYEVGFVFLQEGMVRRKGELFTRAHEELGKALAVAPKFPAALFADGQALAYMGQDDAAKARFEAFVALRPEGDPDRQRALRYISQPELARSRMAPPFTVTTLDGQRLSMDELQGKVVLIDFWATWCGPCREAMPHVKSMARKFAGQPLVILSVSLDSDEQKWRDFIAKNEMTWPQYFDGSSNGSMARIFGVDAIPHTFTIDADGVLQDEHIGDASIEGKLKKLIAHAQEIQTAQKPQ